MGAAPGDGTRGPSFLLHAANPARRNRLDGKAGWPSNHAAGFQVIDQIVIDAAVAAHGMNYYPAPCVVDFVHHSKMEFFYTCRSLSGQRPHFSPSQFWVGFKGRKNGLDFPVQASVHLFLHFFCKYGHSTA